MNDSAHAQKMPWQRCLRSDTGSTMVTVLIVMLVLSTGAIAIAGLMQHKTVELERNRSHAIAQSVLDYAVNAWLATGERAGRQCGGLHNVEPLELGGKSYSVRLMNVSCPTIFRPGYVKFVTTVNGVKAAREVIFDVDEGKLPYLVTRNSLNLNLKTSSYMSRPDAVWVLPNPDGTRNTVHCHPGFQIAGGLYTEKTDVYSSPGGCRIGAKLFADDISLSGGSFVGGTQLVAAHNLTIDGSVQVGHTSWSSGVVRGDIHVGGNFHGKNLAAKFFDDMTVNGNVTIESGARPIAKGGISHGGTVTTPGTPDSWTTNSVTQMFPPLPQVPSPPDHMFWPTMYRHQIVNTRFPGRKVINWTGPCNGGGDGGTNAPLWTLVKNESSVQVYDSYGNAAGADVYVFADHCDPLIFPPNAPVLAGGSGRPVVGLTANITFVAPSFHAEGTEFRSRYGVGGDLPDPGVNIIHAWHFFIPDDGLVNGCASINTSVFRNAKLGYLEQMFPPSRIHGKTFMHTPCHLHIDTPHPFTGALNAGILTGDFHLFAHGLANRRATYVLDAKNFRVMTMRDLFGNEL